jgi:hypothetical protein
MRQEGHRPRRPPQSRQVRRVIGDGRKTGPLKHGDAGDARGGFDEVDHDAKAQISEKEYLERIAVESQTRRDAQDEECEQGHKRNLVQLRRMPVNAVPEVDAPGETCGGAARAVAHPGQKTPNAADRDARGQRDDEEITGRNANAEPCFDQFDGEQSTNEAAHNRFPLQEHGGIVTR